MFILAIDALVQLALDLAIRDQKAREAAKLATHAGFAGAAAAMGDVASAVAGSILTGGEAAKHAVDDPEMAKWLDTGVNVAAGAAGGFTNSIANGVAQLGFTAGTAAGGAGVGYAIDQEHGAEMGLQLGASLGGGEFDAAKVSEKLIETGIKGAGGAAGASIAYAAANESEDPAEKRAAIQLGFSLGMTGARGAQKLGGAIGELGAEPAEPSSDSSASSATALETDDRNALKRALDHANAIGATELGTVAVTTGGGAILDAARDKRDPRSLVDAMQRVQSGASIVLGGLNAGADPKATEAIAASLRTGREIADIVTDETLGAKARQAAVRARSSERAVDREDAERLAAELSLQRRAFGGLAHAADAVSRGGDAQVRARIADSVVGDLFREKKRA